MTRNQRVRDHLRGARIRLRPSARRRALIAGLVAGPLSTAGFGFALVGVQGLLSTPSAVSGIFTGVGLVSIAGAFAAGIRLMRPHHRGTRAAVQAIALVGMPLALIAGAIIANVILSLSLSFGPAGGEPIVVFPVSWCAVAVPGLVLGPLAMWWTAHMNRALPATAIGDSRAAEKFEATTIAD